MHRALLTSFNFPLLILFGFLALVSQAQAVAISGLSSHVQQPMQFEVQQGTCMLKIGCKRWIYAYGDIDRGSPARLKAVLDTVGEERILVALNSAGGDYRAAIEMGKMLREHILPATVASSTICAEGHFCSPPELKPSGAECDYACVFVLLGSATRTMADSQRFYLPRLGAADGIPPGTIRSVVADDGRALAELVDDYLTLKALDREWVKFILGVTADGPNWIEAMRAQSVRIITGYSTGTPAKTLAGETQPAAAADLQQENGWQKHTVTSLAYPGQAPMSFVLFRTHDCISVRKCQNWISAEGAIGAETPERLKTFIREKNADGLTLFVNSRGGDYAAAMALGRIAREHHMKIGVGAATLADCPPSQDCRNRAATFKRPPGLLSIEEAHCDFACVFFLAGGTDRAIGARTGLAFPVQSASLQDIAIIGRQGLDIRFETGAEDGAFNRDVWAYLQEMGVSSDINLDLLNSSRAFTIRNDHYTLYQRRLITRLDAPDAYLRKPKTGVIVDLDSSMQFYAVRSAMDQCVPRCVRWIAAVGVIDDGAPSRLLHFLDGLEGQKLPIVIQSQGGSVNAAMELGRIIRRAGLSTAVAETTIDGCTIGEGECGRPERGQSDVIAHVDSDEGFCMSACPLMLSGGVERVASPETDFRIHTFFRNRPGKIPELTPAAELYVDVARDLAGPVRKYLKSMGVKRKLFDLLRTVKPTDLRALSPKERLRLNLTTRNVPAIDLLREHARG